MFQPRRGLDGWIAVNQLVNDARTAEKILERIQFGDTTKVEVDWLRRKNELSEGTFMSVRKMCRQLIDKHTIHLITERLKK